MNTPRGRVSLAIVAAVAMTDCNAPAPTDVVRVSGHVEATEVQVATDVGGRLVELQVAEGDRVTAGAVVA